jgi:DNA-binding MarR family transcriptional regulator
MAETDERSTEISSRVFRHWHEAVPDDRMAHLVKDAARSFLRSLQARLVQHEVSLGHWTFLRILWEQEGLTQRELSQEAGVMESTTLVALRAMEAAGYVERRQLPGNKKNIHVFLTDKGKRLKKKLVPLAEQVNQLALSGLKDSDVATTRRTLLLMLDNLLGDPELQSAKLRGDLL